MSADIRLKALDRHRPEDVRLFQSILESAPTYAERISGSRIVSPSQASENMEALPLGLTFDGKFVFAILVEDKPVACADVIRGYPIESTAMIGLLLLSEAHQRRDLGRLIYGALEECLRSWPGITKLRIGVVSTNAEVLTFWRKMGFAETGVRKPYECGKILAENIILEKDLANRSWSETAS